MNSNWDQYEEDMEEDFDDDDFDGEDEEVTTETTGPVVSVNALQQAAGSTVTLLVLGKGSQQVAVEGVDFTLQMLANGNSRLAGRGVSFSLNGKPVAGNWNDIVLQKGDLVVATVNVTNG